MLWLSPSLSGIGAIVERRGVAQSSLVHSLVAAEHVISFRSFLIMIFCVTEKKKRCPQLQERAKSWTVSITATSGIRDVYAACFVLLSYLSIAIYRHLPTSTRNTRRETSSLQISVCPRAWRRRDGRTQATICTPHKLRLHWRLTRSCCLSLLRKRCARILAEQLFSIF